MSSLNSKFSSFFSTINRQLNSKVRIAMAIVMVLQLYFLPLISLVANQDYTKYINYIYAYVMSSYTIIIFSITVFHVGKNQTLSDHFTLWAIVLSSFLRPPLKGGGFEIFYRTFMGLIGILLSIYILLNLKSMKTPSFKTVLIGLFWSVGTVLVLALLYAQISSVHGSVPSNLLSYIINSFVFQLSFVVIVEEVCFRGLLFSLMIENGIKENNALVIQAILFWGIHYTDINNPVLFFVIVPLFTISATMIIKKYKMLYLSMMMHLFQNVFGAVLVALF